MGLVCLQNKCFPYIKLTDIPYISVTVLGKRNSVTTQRLS